jgi:hypothetical protein
MCHVAVLSAHGIIDFNSSTTSILGRAVGITGANRLADGQVEVVFDDPDYVALQSTVLVTPRSSVPTFATWDSYGLKSVRVRLWDTGGTALPAGSFSIALVHS